MTTGRHPLVRVRDAATLPNVAPERTCPECSAAVPALAGYPDWCDRCGWNLKPPALPRPVETRFERLAERLGRSAGQRMARELREADKLAPRMTPAKLAAYAIAAGVHLTTAALVLGGAAAVVLGFPNPILMMVGALWLGIGVIVRPRAGEMPEGEVVEAAPALLGLVGRIAAQLDRPPPDAVVVSSSFNASWSVVGLRRRRVLELGLPLLAALAPGERVAVIGHELAHDRNGDSRRSLLLFSALDALNRLAFVLRPTGDRRLANLFGPVEFIADFVVWLLSRPVDGLLWLEARLLLRDSQRAEYLADELAARVAGTTATVALHERLLLASAMQLAVQHASAAGPDIDVLARVREAVQTVPERERLRRRRVARLEETRLEATHPPTGMRIALLEDRPPLPAAVSLSDVESARIDAELAPLERRVGLELVDHYRRSLYYG